MLTWANFETLITCGLLTLLASFLTVVISVLLGAIVAYRARPTLTHGVILAALFLPFAMGESIWSYSLARLFLWFDLQADLVNSTTAVRSAALLGCCLARTIPLGVFFCATSLQRYSSSMLPYFQTHRLSLFFFLECSIQRIPQSVYALLGLFAGALTAQESSLPLFLYRANPGTGPETVNVLLSRLFRECYASLGSASLTSAALIGIFVSALLLGVAFLGTMMARRFLAAIRFALSENPLQHRLLESCTSLVAPALLLPSGFGLLGLLVPISLAKFDVSKVLSASGRYQDITFVAFVIGVSLSSLCLATAVGLRYSRVDRLERLEKNFLAPCGLFYPAFVPLLSVVAVLGIFTNGQMSGPVGYLTMMVCHLALHISIFLYVFATIIASIPERHVAWQRCMRIRYFFSLLTDGFKRHLAVVCSMIGLGFVLVMTDGIVSRWFSNLVTSPEESLYASVFGRRSDYGEALIIAWLLMIAGMAVSGLTASFFVFELKRRPKYA